MKRCVSVLVVMSLLALPVLVHTADPPAKPAAPVKESLTTDDARAALARDAQQRQQACQKAIAEACQKYGFALQARPQIVDGRIVADVVLVPVQ